MAVRGVGVNREVTIVKCLQRAVSRRKSKRLQSLSGGREKCVGVNLGGYNH